MKCVEKSKECYRRLAGDVTCDYSNVYSWEHGYMICYYI